jgi:hypothetical protein
MNVLRKITIFSATAVLLFLCWEGPQDVIADARVDAGMLRALASFATARSLNAAISVAQESSVSASLLGVGGTLAIGQILDPINDLIESFSSLMLIACVAFGTQAILLKIGADWILMTLLSTVITIWAGLNLLDQKSPNWLSRIALILVMVRFAIPMTIIGSDFVFENFLAGDYVDSQESVSKATKTLEEINSEKPKPTVKEQPADEAGIIEKYTGIKTENIKIPDFNIVESTKIKYDSAISELNGAVRKTINLIVIFLLQTLFVPIFILWAMYGICKNALEFAKK